MTVALGLGACAASPPQLQQLGPDSYMYTVEAERVPDGKVIARQQVRDEALKFCTAQGKHVRETHLHSGISDFQEGGPTELNFRCVDEPYNNY